MNFLLSFFGGLFGILIAIAVIVLIIYFSLRKYLGGNRLKSLVNAASYASKMQGELPQEKKNVTGMTKIYEPLILKDFPDFNKELLYSKIESSLNYIFNTLENKYVSENEDMVLIKKSLQEKIDDLSTRNVNVRYDDVVFHRHAIKEYKKEKGMATITTSSTLEYYYDDGKKSNFKEVKKQTRYTCKFVYVYDSNLLKENKNLNIDENVFVVNCPNCGAPLKDISQKRCIYCGSMIEDINMKTWKICSYDEDYK